MAFKTIWNIDSRNVMFEVLLSGRCWLVLVAAITGVFDIRTRVTDLASALALLAVIEREGVIAQESGRPDIHAVAVLTFHPEETGVDGRLGMTLDALGRELAQNPFQVAIPAGDLGMASIEYEKCRMIEVIHSIPAVVTFQAVRAGMLNMGLHKGRIVLTVAVGAGIQVNRGNAARMASAAQDWLLLIIYTVMFQAEGDFFEMVVWFPFQGCWQPASCGMA